MNINERFADDDYQDEPRYDPYHGRNPGCIQLGWLVLCVAVLVLCSVNA